MSGIAIGTALACGRAQRGMAVAGALVGLVAFNISLGRSAGMTAVLFFGHAVELALAIVLTRRLTVLPLAINRFRQLIELFGATVAAAAASGAVVALGLRAVAFSDGTLLHAWWAWFASHVVGITAVAPLIALLRTELPAWHDLRREDAEGIAGLAALTAIVCATLFGGMGFDRPLAIANLALLQPVLLWLAIRCRPLYSAIGVFIVAAAVSTEMSEAARAGVAVAATAGQHVFASQTLILFCSFSILALALTSQSRRAVTAELALSEQKFRTIYDRAHVFIGLLDAEGRLLEANRRALDFIGARLEDIAGLPFADTPWWKYSAADRLRIEQAIEKGRRGEADRFEAVVGNSAGEWITIDCTLTPIFDAGGKVVRLQPEGRDITGIKRSEAALRQSEERLRLATEAAGIGTFVVDVVSGIAHYSPELALLLGFPETREVRVEDALQRVHRDDVTAVRAAYAKALEDSGDGRLKMELRFVRPGGKIRWMWFNGEVKFREQSQPGRRIAERIVGACADITDRKRAEAALRESEERLRLALNAGEMGTWDWDLRTNTATWDTRQRILFGLAEGNEPVRYEHFVERVHPDDREGMQRVTESILGSAGAFRHEFRIVLQNGEIRWLLGWARSLFDTAGRPLRMVGVNLDVTDRKQAEAALRESEELNRSTLQALPAHIAVLDERGRIAAVNDAWTEFAVRNAADRQSVAVGANYLDLCRKAASECDDAARALAGIEAVLARRQPQFSLEYPCHSPSEQRWFLMSVVPLHNGPREGAVVAHSNITDRKLAEQLLANANQMLEARVADRTRELEAEMQRREAAQAALAHAQRMEAVGQLTGGVAHDMNNMLTVVCGNLELAMQRIDDARARQAVQQAIDAADMGASLNRRLLSFARQRKLEPVDFVLNDRVMEMARLLGRSLGNEIAVESKLDPGAWVSHADPGEVDNAILNLAINARDAMPGGGTLTIATANVALDAAAAASHPDSRPGDYVRLTVIDTGHGMTPEVARRAIEPFYSTKGSGKGTGLGLSSVYGFVRQSGGFLEIASRVGSGTRVDLYLPRSPAAAAATLGPDRREAIPTGDGELILVVEDNDQVREVTLERLESLGYAVLEARTVAEALDVLAGDGPIVLVFSDVMMPGGKTGYDLARWITTERPHLAVLLTSGHNEVRLDRDRPELALIRVLRKPYSRALLASAIRETLDARDVNRG